MTRITAGLAIVGIALAGAVGTGAAQSTEATVSQLLSGAHGDSAARIVAEARAAGLPVASLEMLTRQGILKGMKPEVVVTALTAEARRLGDARAALAQARREPSEPELRAGSDALHRGVPPEAITRLAGAAPPDRPLEVPIFVLAGLVDRGVPVGDALAAVGAHMRDGTDDRELGELPLHATRLFARGLPTSDVVRTLLLMEQGLGEDLVPRNPGVQVQRVPSKQNN